jgi:hypothetical protein
MSHNIRCETAMSPPEKCQCRCGGKYHGIHARNLPPGARFMNRAAGGELGRIIQILNGKQLAMICGIQIRMVLFVGIPNENGIPDRTGKKWAVYSKCRYLVDGKCTKLNTTPHNTAECKPVIIVPTSVGITEIDHLSLMEIKIVCFLSAGKVWEFQSLDEPIVIDAR